MGDAGQNTVELPAGEIPGYRFKNSKLLRQALTHKSYSSEHNERLEFLGDSVLNFSITAILYRRFQDLDEGRLSQLRAQLVCGESLAEVAHELQLDDVLLLGLGEAKSGGRRRKSILADSLEAVLGAIYLDSDVTTVSAVIEQWFASRIAGIDPSQSSKDAKTQLQEWLQARQLPLPEYSLVTTTGKAHQKQFTVQCKIEPLPQPVTGKGRSRRSAEQLAASQALERLGAVS